MEVDRDSVARGGVRRYLDSVHPKEYVPSVGEVDLRELSLTGLADLYGSDKGSIKHRYCDVYSVLVERLLCGVDRRAARLKIVEFGVACGASLRMWANYLPSSSIYGVDVGRACDRLCSDLSNVFIEIGDVALRGIQAAPLACQGEKPDLIIDDASHISEDILGAFKASWEYLAPGGFYVIEDLSCTYSESYMDQFGRLIKSSAQNGRATITGLMDALMRLLDRREAIQCLEYYPQMLVVRKASR